MSLAALALTLAAATPGPAATALPSLPPAMMKLAMPSYSAGSSSIAVKIDQPFQIRLDVTSGTGYTWMPQGPLPFGITLLGVFQQPRGKMMPGGPGQEVLVFRGGDAGKARLTLGYVRPWERGVKPAKLRTFTIAVHR
jgi:predicted secreted protein